MLKLVISALAIVVMLSAPSAFAMSANHSGFLHGTHDAKHLSHWYILQHGKGFQYHTINFTDGYVHGFCSIRPDITIKTIEAMFSCNDRTQPIGYTPK